VEGSLTNPVTPGGQDGGEANPAPVHGRVQGGSGQAAARGRQGAERGRDRTRLSPGQLSAWRNEHLAAGSAEALTARKAEQAELQRLKRENKRLEEEVEILRKAAAFFARGIA
jgi:transposase